MRTRNIGRVSRAAKKVPISREIYNNTRFTVINRLRARERVFDLSHAARARAHIHARAFARTTHGHILFQIIISDRPFSVLADVNGGV